MLCLDPRHSPMEDLDAFYKLRENCEDVAISRFRPQKGKRLSERKWRASFGPEGQLKMDKVLPRIESGGVHPSMRGEVWEFLLGCFSPSSTIEERAALRTFRREQYAILKAECQAMDSAIGSGVVVTLPRLAEDGGPTQNHTGKSSLEEKVAHKSASIPLTATLHTSADATAKDFPLSNSLFNNNDISVDQATSRLENHPKRVHEAGLNTAFAMNVESIGGHVVGIKRERPETGTSDSDSNSMSELAFEDENSTSQDYVSCNDYCAVEVKVFPEKDQQLCEANGSVDEFTDGKLPNISPLDNKVVQWKLLLHQIGLDVIRTDRMLQFYEEPKNLAKLWDVLSVYAWFDEDVGYCQGMSDLCSAMVVLFPEEADAFWCFERLMHRVRENFRCNGQTLGVLKQLAVLGSVMEVVDSRLHKHLEALGGGMYMFAVRMLMVHFRREFSFSDALYLWEMMWASEFGAQTDLSKSEQNYLITLKVVKQEPKTEAVLGRRKAYISNGKFVRRTIKYGSSKLDKGSTPLAIFCVAGILEMNQRKLLKGTKGLDEVLKIFNDTTGKLDAKQVCKRALRIYKEYLIKLASQ